MDTFLKPKKNKISRDPKAKQMEKRERKKEGGREGGRKKTCFVWLNIYDGLNWISLSKILLRRTLQC